MKTSSTQKLLITALSFGFVALPALRAQDQSTNASTGTNASASAICTTTTNSCTGCGGEKKWRQNKEQALSNLSDAERQQLKAAMGKIKGDPKLVAAREAMKEAQTKEAKHAARESLQQVRHDLLLNADPTIQPVLDKIKKGAHAGANAPDQVTN